MISFSNKWCYILSMRNIVVILFFLFIVPVLTEDLSGEFSHSNEFSLTASTETELKAEYSHDISLPFLNSPNALFESNEISFQNILQDTEITIIDIQSKIVHQSKLNTDKTIPASFPPGQYLILSKNKNLVKHFKLIKY